MHPKLLLKELPQISIDEYLLRKIDLVDTEDLFKILSDKEVIAYYNSSIHKTLDDSKRFIMDILKGYKKGYSMILGIVTKEEGNMIGICGYHSWSKFNRRAQILYAVSRENWGKGTMSKVMEPFIEFGFNQLGLNRIEAIIAPENICSTKLVLKHNFKQEGILREHGFKNDTLGDFIMYSLLKREYLAIQESKR